MSRQALKNVLLDLKSQMRGKRASSYMKKPSDEQPIEDVEGISTKKTGADPVAKLSGDTEALAPVKEPKTPKVDGPVDFAEEMKNFFKKQNTGKKREAPSAFASFASEKPSAPSMPKAPAKKKGK